MRIERHSQLPSPDVTADAMAVYAGAAGSGADPVVRSLLTSKSVLTWSEDGATVTKQVTGDIHDSVLGAYRRAAINEVRVNRLLLAERPPVLFPPMVAASRRSRSLTFAAIQGEPLGPKYPLDMTESDLDGLLGVVRSLEPYRPRRRWFRRLSIGKRLRHHVREGILTPADADAVQSLVNRSPLSFRFSHGDVTARNVLRDHNGRFVLIDWERAGYYPRGYEAAFLWFSLIDVPDARIAVQRTVTGPDSMGFLVSALLIQALHVHLLRQTASPFRAKHQDHLGRLLRCVHRS